MSIPPAFPKFQSSQVSVWKDGRTVRSQGEEALIWVRGNIRQMCTKQIDHVRLPLEQKLNRHGGQPDALPERPVTHR